MIDTASIKPIMLVDIDGVLADFNGTFLKLSRKLLAKPHKDFVVTDFDYEKCGWTLAEVNRVFGYIRHTENFWQTLARMPQTSSLKRAEKQFNLVFVTSRMSTDGWPVYIQSENWLKQQFALESPYVIVSNHKGVEANAIEADYAIDDKVENCLAIANERPSCKVFILDAPYNRSLIDSRIERVESFNEFTKRITES